MLAASVWFQPVFAGTAFLATVMLFVVVGRRDGWGSASLRFALLIALALLREAAVLAAQSYKGDPPTYSVVDARFTIGGIAPIVVGGWVFHSLLSDLLGRRIVSRYFPKENDVFLLGIVAIVAFTIAYAVESSAIPAGLWEWMPGTYHQVSFLPGTMPDVAVVGWSITAVSFNFVLYVIVDNMFNLRVYLRIAVVLGVLVLFLAANHYLSGPNVGAFKDRAYAIYLAAICPVGIVLRIYFPSRLRSACRNCC